MLFTSTLLNTGCTAMTGSNDGNLSENEAKPLMGEGASLDGLQQALALAIENKDYRLLVTSGRSMSIPGVKSSDYQRVIELCGKKYNAKAGDVITSEEQRSARKKEVNYMRQYNEQILLLCQENTNK